MELKLIRVDVHSIFLIKYVNVIKYVNIIKYVSMYK